jgi:hypothetical protein
MAAGLPIRGDLSAAALRAYARRAPSPRAAARAFAVAHALEGLRWSLSAGQFGGWDKLGSGFRQAANLSISPASYASSRVYPARALCGRPAL